MPTPSVPAPAPDAESRYPNVERYVEGASKEALGTLFAGLKAELGAMKGPKAEHARKASGALDRAEELLGHLIDVRERLIAEQKSAKRR